MADCRGPTSDPFNAAWLHFVGRNMADGFGGSQWRRARVDWVAAGQLRPVLTWLGPWLEIDDSGHHFNNDEEYDAWLDGSIIYDA